MTGAALATIENVRTSGGSGGGSLTVVIGPGETVGGAVQSHTFNPNSVVSVTGGVAPYFYQWSESDGYEAPGDGVWSLAGATTVTCTPSVAKVYTNEGEDPTGIYTKSTASLICTVHDSSSPPIYGTSPAANYAYTNTHYN